MFEEQKPQEQELSLSTKYEEARVRKLRELDVVEGNVGEDLQAIIRSVSNLFDVPYAYLSLVDSAVQRMKVSCGFAALDILRSESFCTHTIEQREVFVVEDTLLHETFKENPSVKGRMGIRFYAGAPLIVDGYGIGALCVMDTEPRKITEKQVMALKDMASLVVSQISLRRDVGRVDPISGMPNKYQLEEDLSTLQALAKGQRRVLAHIAVPDSGTAFEISSVLGIDAYDNLVSNVAARVKALFQGKSNIYHLSDTQFAMLSRNENAKEFYELIQKAIRELLEPIKSMNVPLNLLSYCGVVEFDAEQDDVPDVFRKALSASRQAFNRKIRLANYDSSGDVYLQRSFRLLNDLHEAVAMDGFSLMYQPKFNLADRKFDGVEALLRWDHPELGAISPAEFVPLVEKTALIRPLTEWVMKTALAQLKEWHGRGYDFKLAVNFSPRNFEEIGIDQRIQSICSDFSIDPSYLEIECTEGIWMQSAGVIDTLQKIAKLGVAIALDDFGTGYSNFAYLQEVPATVIKIDQSLIQKTENNPRDRRIVQALIRLSKDLHYRIVAEGVETEEVFHLMRKWGVDEIQGYFMGKPMPAATLERHIAQPIEVSLFV